MPEHAAASQLLGPYLKKLRSEAGLSLRQVAKLSARIKERQGSGTVGFEYLCRAEGGGVVPSPEKLVTLSSIYGVPTQRFLDQIEVALLERHGSAAPLPDEPAECLEIARDALNAHDLTRGLAACKRGLALMEARAASDAASRKLAYGLTNNLGVAQMLLGKMAAAQQQFEEILGDRSIDEGLAALAMANMATIAYRMDRLRLAEALVIGAMRLTPKPRDPRRMAEHFFTLALVRRDLAQVYAARIDPELDDDGAGRESEKLFASAEDLLRRCLRAHADDPASPHGISTALALGDLHSILENPEQTDRYYRLAYDLAERNGGDGFRAEARLARGRALYLRGQTAEARTVLEEGRELALRNDLTSELFHCTYYLWRLALEEKSRTEATERFKALKRLRLSLDERTEELQSFDQYLEQVRERRRRRRKVS